MVAIPNLTLTITPPGGTAVDYTRFLAWSGAFQQLTITQNFGRQGDTAQLALIEEYTTTPIVVVPVLSQIKLVDSALGITLFAGVVNDPVLTPTSPTRNEWTLHCTDYTFYADNALVFGPDFNGFTADAIVLALTQQANCGITAAPVSQGGFVAPGPTLPSVAIGYQSLSAAWRKLAQLAGQVTPYGWYVDENLRLHFYDSTTALDSSVTFTTSPTMGGSTTEGHVTVDSQFGYEWDGTSVHNRILVQGGAQTVASPAFLAPTDTWRGDGVTMAWPLRYTFNNINRFLVNGHNTALVVVAPGGVPTGVWNVQQNATGAYFLTTTTPPAAGTLIQFWYSYKIPIVAQANDFASQQTYSGPNGGVFAEYVSDSSLSDVSMALARAQRERTEYAFAAERTTFNTSQDWIGWLRSGQTFRYVNQFVPDSQNNYTWGLNDTFLCVQNRITFTAGGYRTMQVTGVRI